MAHIIRFMECVQTNPCTIDKCPYPKCPVEEQDGKICLECEHHCPCCQGCDEDLCNMCPEEECDNRVLGYDSSINKQKEE